MKKIKPFIAGLFASSLLIVLFREFFTSSQHHVFHFPIFLSVIMAELALGFKFVKHHNLNIKNPALISTALLIISFWIPVAVWMIASKRNILGLSYNASLPWYALTLYPGLIFLPFAFVMGLKIHSLFDNKTPNITFFISGVSVFLLLDFILLWQIPPLILSFAIAFLGLVISFFYSQKTAGKVFRITSAVFAVFIFSALLNNFENESIIKGGLFNASSITPYGKAVLKEENSDYTFLLNHKRIFSFPDKKNIQETAHLSMLQYPAAENILVIGEWNTLANEVSKYPFVESIYWANPIPQSVDPVSRFISSETAEKVRKLRISDPRLFIRRLPSKDHFDVVIISLPDPTDIFFNRYYTHEFIKELKAKMADNSIIALNINWKEGSGKNADITTLSILETIRRNFNNTLEIPPLIIGTQTRNFTTYWPALVEFLNSVDPRPHHISPALIRHRINSPGFNISADITDIPLNTDSKPAPFVFALNNLFFEFGFISPRIINFTMNMKPYYIYVFFAILFFTPAFFISRKNIHSKTSFLCALSGIIFSIILYSQALSMFSYNGQIYRYVSSLIASFIIGGAFIVYILKKSRIEKSITRVRLLLFISGLFFIIITPVWEFSSSPLPIYLSLLFSLLCGGFFGGILSECFKISEDRCIFPLFAGCAMAGAVIIFFIPITGIVNILPALGILSLSGIITLNI